MPNPSGNRQHRALVTLGKAIRATRRGQGISQEKLALLADVDRSYMGRIERGDNNVAFLTLLKVCRALKVKVEDLVHEAGL